jgi:site-specific DNA-adenine methylase
MKSDLGSKAITGLCRPIISIMPAHKTYIETHLGSGEVMRRKPPALENIAIDRDLNVLKTFRCDYTVKKIYCCAHQFLKTYDFKGYELVYCDPPYLLYTRNLVPRYRFDYKEKDHIELLELIKKLPCSVIISGHPTKLYDMHLSDWGSLELQVTNQVKVWTEKLWFNYALDEHYWARTTGNNALNRYSIKKSAIKWAERYQEVSRSERIALLSSIMAVEAQENESQ